MFRRFLITLCLVAFIGSTAPSVAQAAFGDTQLKSVIELLKSFGVNADVISKVETSLRTTIDGSTVVKAERPALTDLDVYKPPTAWRHAICNRVFNQSFVVGAKGEAVKDIQLFLREEGFLSAEITGFFGKLTHDALGRWQTEQGLVSSDSTIVAKTGWGMFGPRTREHIRVWCDKGHDRFKAEPQRGAAPLSVTFSAWVGGFTPYTFWLDFGDGSARQQLSCSAPADVCVEPAKTTHVYVADGTYSAVLYRKGHSATSTEEAIGKKVIQVSTKPESCTKEYKPICGQPSRCKVLPGGVEMCAKPDPQTYGNECLLKQAGASVLYEGACKQKPFEPSPSCKTWYDGCNDCSRETPGGPVSCTERACIWQAPGYCTQKFPSDEPVACTMEYNPVCAQPPEPSCRKTPPYCMLPTPGPTTYGNKCMMRAAGATLLYEGQCSCRQIAPPLCDNGTLISLGNDENGCSKGYACKMSQTSCRQIMPPLCDNGTLISLGNDENGCSKGYECRNSATGTR